LSNKKAHDVFQLTTLYAFKKIESAITRSRGIKRVWSAENRTWMTRIKMDFFITTGIEYNKGFKNPCLYSIPVVIHVNPLHSFSIPQL
jgi:hypothetical protein